MRDAQGELSMNVGELNERITFRRTDDERETYTDVLTCRGCIKGVSGDEAYLANAGFEALSVVTITVRYQLAIMGIDPTKHIAVDRSGAVYDLVSPAEDKGGRHIECVFRARRVFADEERSG